MSKNGMGKLEEQEMKKIRSIKLNVMGGKPKIISDKLKDKIIDDIWTLFEIGKEKIQKRQKIIKDKIIWYIRTLFEDYYEPKRVSNFWNNNYIKYERNGDKNRNLSLDEYLPKIKPYLTNIIINFQNSDALKIHLTIVINFISAKDVEEEHIMHSDNVNI